MLLTQYGGSQVVWKGKVVLLPSVRRPHFVLQVLIHILKIMIIKILMRLAVTFTATRHD